MNWRAFLLVFLLPALALADPVGVQTIPSGPDKIQSVKKGEMAPYSGQLFDASTAIRWANWLQQYKARLASDIDEQKQICKVETSYQGKVLAIEKERSSTVEKDLRGRLLRSEKARLAAEQEARNPPWYKTRDFGVVVGVTTTALAVVALLWAAGQVQK